ncbi:MAG TPA: ABC-type transport auxiliary lipoprotein family protein [Rhodanobacteraceae bacterium]|nr:ABC-type transport auxiliary lipoprotein family protein [Rhodanobacteraceae bacterium]
MKIRTLLPGLIATLGLAACSGLLPKAEPFDIYRLAHAPAAASTAAKVNWQLRVEDPETSRMLAGSHIIVLPDASRQSAYAGARWAEAAPKLLRNRLIDAFREDGRVPMVSGDDDNLAADYVLGGNLGAFQSEYRDGHPVVVIRLDAWLLAQGQPKPVANHGFAVEEPVGATDVASVVAAFGRAADRLSQQLVDWTLQQARVTSRAAP